MLKLHAALTTALAAALLAPAAVLGEQDIDALDRALDDTRRALEVLAGIDARIREGDLRSTALPPGATALPCEATELARAVSEAPILDATERDARLVALRNEVSLLQAELDLFDMPGAGAALEPREASAQAPRPGEPPAPQPIVPTIGLDDDARALIAELRTNPRTQEIPESPEPAPEALARGSKPIGPAYSADPLRQAQACYRLGELARGLELLRSLPETIEVLEWRARLQARADRLDEATATLRRLVEIAGEGPVAERARSELEFIEWKRGFLARLPIRARTNGSRP